MQHYIEHTLIAVPIALLAMLIVWLVAKTASRWAVLGAVGWIGGTFYYAGREVRDYEKGTVGPAGFDYSGLLVQMVVLALVFGGAALYLERRLGAAERQEGRVYFFSW